MDESMESGLQFWRMRRAVLAHSTTQTKQQFDEIFAEIKEFWLKISEIRFSVNVWFGGDVDSSHTGQNWL